MIKATNSIKGKINTPQNLKGKTNTSIIREYPELENIEITPTVEDQTYTPKKYGFEEVKVKGVQAYIDEDIKPEYIKDGVDILGVIGNVVELQGEEKTITPSTTQQIIVPSDGKNGMTRLTVEAVDSSIDENIKPENIKEGTNILGVDGQYRGIDTSNATATANDILKGKTSYSQNEEIVGTIETYDGSYEGNAGEGIIKITNCYGLFIRNSRLDYLNELLSLCEDVTSTGQMFYGSNLLEEIDLRNFDTSKVTSMVDMFNSCSGLTTLDLSNFDTSNVISMDSMFSGCSGLTSLDLSNFDTNNVTNMAYMFNSCSSLTSLNVSSFNTSEVTNMSYMFNSCYDLTSLDLSNFDTSKVTKINSMFSYCTKLTDLKSFKNLGKGYTQQINNYRNYTLSLSDTYETITLESLIDVIKNGLYDLNLTYDVANGGTLYRQSLELGSVNLEKLQTTEEGLQALEEAYQKGWDIS